MRREMMRGWAIGDDDYRKEVADRLLRQYQLHAVGASERRELLELEWQQKLAELLEQEKKTKRDIQQDRKGAPWKQRVAIALRKTTTASNPWVSQYLNCGHPSYISKWLKNERF